ncbi:pectinesterase [Cellvibrio zantedeschiae]|uniref:Pectinesterase n=1 Tax=Cellvibrio zantedeschiae TaxID=1237077 RepID=A0ABQ3BAM5_9GAMM|nr:pectinesterase family protein [Cellvibrio zantedeschiae]GGY86251.1 pectinesterase [Cellvibrio zantedeschiae]
MRIIFLLLAILIQVSCSSSNTASQNVNASGSAQVKSSCNNNPHCFEKIQAAIDAAPQISTSPYRIFIADGTYQEKLIINKNNIELVGQSSSKTRIVFNDYAGKEVSPGKNLTTPGSATLTIKATDIRLQNLTIENSFDFLKNDALPSDSPQKVNGSQAVALFIDAPSDRVLVRNVTMLGYQDTLFVNSGRSWFDKVLIAGNVDYIFGNGNALFTQSEIKTLARGKPTSPHGFITAPSTQINSKYGLTFLSCRLTRDNSVPDSAVPLGRPWHPTTQFADGRYADPNAIGKTVFVNTWMDAHITADGWYSMGGSTKEGGRINFLPEDSRFFEHKSTGPGAIINDKHRQLSEQEAKEITRKNILGDWNPK